MDDLTLRAYLESLLVASLLVPNRKGDETIKRLMRLFGEFAEARGGQAFPFKLQAMLVEVRRDAPTPAALWEKFVADLRVLAGGLSEAAQRESLLDQLAEVVALGEEEGYPCRQLLEAAARALSGRAEAATIVPGRPANPPAAATSADVTCLPEAPKPPSAEATQLPDAPGAAPAPPPADDVTRMAPPAPQPSPATQTAAVGTMPLDAFPNPVTASPDPTRMAPPPSAAPAAPEYHNALPAGYKLHEYRVDRVLGVGGFGITYLGRDTTLDLKVAIKEYLPNELAVRNAESTVVPKSPADVETYQWGLDRFLQEARLLARFNHPNIVRVLRFFEGNGTAYMIMQYEEGESLDDRLRKTSEAPGEAELKAILLPLLEGLKTVHDEGFLHRDIKPGNIYLRRDGSPVLLDFGAARAQLRGMNQNLTAIVTPGYAPFEQYFSEGHQGPWSDIYAFGAVLYRAITGRPPAEAVSRSKKDNMVPTAEAGRGRYSDKFLRAVDWALQPDEKNRPQEIAEWQRALAAVGSEEARTRQVAPAQPQMAQNASPQTQMTGMAGRGGVAPNPATGMVNTQLLSQLVTESTTLAHPVEKAESPATKRLKLLTLIALFFLLVTTFPVALLVSEAEQPLHDQALAVAEWALKNGTQPDMALDIYRHYANRRDVQAQLALATIFEQGIGVSANEAEALAWYRKAAENGQVEAQFRLGTAYLRGGQLGVERNLSESLRWLKLAAAQGHPSAQETLKLLRR